VVEANSDLNNSPDLVNREPYGGAWMIKVKVKNPAELASLLDAAGYAATL
jgi:glycine cleavage system H protein